MPEPTVTTLPAPTAPAPSRPAATARRAWNLASFNLSVGTFLAGYVALGIVTIMLAVNYTTQPTGFISLGVDDHDRVIIPSLGCALWAWPVLTAVLVSARSYARTLNLGVRRQDFYLGTLLTLVLLSLGVGVVTTGLHYTLDAGLPDNVGGVHDISEAFGHYRHVPALAWLATATAVLVMALIAQAVVLVQARWATRPSLLVPVDAALVAALAVTLSVPSLRHGLGQAFWWTMGGPNPFVQVPVGLAAAAALALLGWVLLRRRTY